MVPGHRLALHDGSHDGGRSSSKDVRVIVLVGVGQSGSVQDGSDTTRMTKNQGWMALGKRIDLRHILRHTMHVLGLLFKAQILAYSGKGKGSD